MKVLLTGPDLDDTKQVGGIITVIKTILSVLKTDHTVFVRSPATGEKDLRGKIKWIGKVFEYVRLLARGQYDVIHIHTAMNRSALLRDFLWIALGRWSRARILLHLHGGKYLFEKPVSAFMRRLIKGMFTRAKALVVLSEKEKKAIEDLYNTKTPIFVLHNAINVNMVPAAAQAAATPRDMQKIIFIGRITESKGIDDIVPAVAQLNKTTQAFCFDLYGDGDLKDATVQALAALLGQRFKYHGIVAGHDKWRALQEADIFLLPSRYGEGLPMALLEAMLLGKIVITTDDASIGLVVQHGINGFMVNKYDPEALQNALAKALRLPGADRTAIAAAAKETILTNFSAGTYIDRLESIYKHITV